MNRRDVQRAHFQSQLMPWIRAYRLVMRGLVALVLCLVPLVAQAADLALVGGTVYPNPKAGRIANAVVLVHDGHIVAVGTRGSIQIPKRTNVIDCSGKVIVSGFWNSHVHILSPTLLHAREASPSQLSGEMDEMFNRWGFTTVFDVGSVLDNTLALRRRIDNGEVKGPRILTTGEPLWTEVPVYVRGYLTAQGVHMPVLSTATGAAAQVRAQIASGADGIKLFTGSLQADYKVANMPLDMVRAAAEAAHRRHLPVFAHPQNSAGVEVAIGGGVDILAHAVPDSPPWTPDFVIRLKKAGMALIPTLTLFDFEARKMHSSEEERSGWIQKMVSELGVFQRCGGEVLFGTDVGYTDHFDTALEFTLMSRSGMNYRQILASLTTAPASRFRYSRHRGQIAKGMDADLVVLDGDPAEDIVAFSKVWLTMRNGIVIFAVNPNLPTVHDL